MQMLNKPTHIVVPVTHRLEGTIEVHRLAPIQGELLGGLGTDAKLRIDVYVHNATEYCWAYLINNLDKVTNKCQIILSLLLKAGLGCRGQLSFTAFGFSFKYWAWKGRVSLVAFLAAGLG